MVLDFYGTSPDQDTILECQRKGKERKGQSGSRLIASSSWGLSCCAGWQILRDLTHGSRRARELMRNPSAEVDGSSNFVVGSLLGRKLERKEKSIKKHLKQASKKKDIDNVSITKDINSVLPSSHTMDILVNTSMVFKKSKKSMNTKKNRTENRRRGPET